MTAETILWNSVPRPGHESARRIAGLVVRYENVRIAEAGS
jgi:hypothetical protein